MESERERSKLMVRCHRVKAAATSTARFIAELIHSNVARGGNTSLSLSVLSAYLSQ